MAAQALALREKGAEYTLSSQIADSRTAYALSLYAKISNITWDYEAPSGKIAGCESFKLITIFQSVNCAAIMLILIHSLTLIN